jgi:glycosyltransferase EpsH
MYPPQGTNMTDQQRNTPEIALNKNAFSPANNAEGPKGSVGVNSRLSAVPEAKPIGREGCELLSFELPEGEAGVGIQNVCKSSGTPERALAVAGVQTGIRDAEGVTCAAHGASDTFDNMSEPLVSVIVPVYNAQDYLQCCIDNVLGQTYGNIELICVDDGSTDASAQILEHARVSDSRVRVISQPNQGPGVARNTGIDAARGQYLLFVDADDYWRPMLVEHAVARAREFDADIVAFNYSVFNQRVGLEHDPDWTLVASRYPQDRAFDWRENPEPLFFTFENLPWNKMFKAQFIAENNIRYFDTYLTEDLMFSGSALVLAKKIVTLDERLMIRREDIGTNIMAGKDKHPFDFINAFAAFREKMAARADFALLEPAYRYWAGSALTYNLLTLNEAATFEAVFDELHASGLARMGLDGAAVKNPFDAQVIEYIKAGSKVDALFFAARLKFDEAKLAQFRLGAAEQETEHVRKQLADMTAWRDGLQRDHDELWARYNQLDAQHRMMEQSAEQRVGQALCKLPRALQRVAKSKG